MSVPPDSSQYIPVVCNEAGRFAGKCYLEKISSVRMLNGQSIPNASTLNKNDFKTGDEVTIRFGAKDFRGTVDFGQEEDVLSERARAESPCSTCSFPSRESAEPPKKRRYRSWEGTHMAQQPKRVKCRPDGRGSSKSRGISRKPRVPGVILAGSCHNPTSLQHTSRAGVPQQEPRSNWPSSSLTSVPTSLSGVPPAIFSLAGPTSTTKLSTFPSGDMWPQLMELRLESMSLKLEMTKNRQWMTELSMTISKLEKVMSEIRDGMNVLQRDIQAVKRRQDLVFKKQDIIHSTLAGEVYRENPSNRGKQSGCSFHTSSGTPSVVAWSPPYTNLQMQRSLSQVPLSAETHPPSQVPLLPGTQSPFVPGYSTPIDIDTFSDEDIQSFLSLDLDRMQRNSQSAEDPLFPPTETPQSSSQSLWTSPHQTLPISEFPLASSQSGIPLASSQSGIPLASSQSHQIQSVQLASQPSFQIQTPPTSGIPQQSLQLQAPSGTPLQPHQSLSTGGTPLQPHQPLSTGGTPLQPHHPLSTGGTPMQPHQPLSTGGVPLPSSHSQSTSVGILLSEVGLIVPIASEETGSRHQGDSSQAHSVSSVSSMEGRNRPNPRGDVPADVVINAFLHKNGNSLDMNNVGRLGVLLARYTYFGDELLQDCTLKGKGNRPGLDPNVIDSLMATIHNTHPFDLMNAAEFRTKIQPKVKRALTDFLKPKSKKASQ